MQEQFRDPRGADCILYVPLRDLRKSQKLFDMGPPGALVSEGRHSESKTDSGPVGLASVAWPEDILAEKILRIRRYITEDLRWLIAVHWNGHSRS